MPDTVPGAENIGMAKMDKIYTPREFTLYWEDGHMNICTMDKYISIHIYNLR